MISSRCRSSPSISNEILRVTIGLSMLLCMTGATPLYAESKDCGWTETDPAWALERVLTEVDLAGTLESAVIPPLYREGVPISFIARSAPDPEIRVRSLVPTTVGELLEELLAQTPGYRLEDVSGRLVIYPSGERGCHRQGETGFFAVYQANAVSVEIEVTDE